MTLECTQVMEITPGGFNCVAAVIHMFQVCCLCRGRLQDSTMVHDEEAEISIRLATLIANSQRNRSAIETPPLDLPSAPVQSSNDAVLGRGAAIPTEALQGVPVFCWRLVGVSHGQSIFAVNSSHCMCCVHLHWLAVSNRIHMSSQASTASTKPPNRQNALYDLLNTTVPEAVYYIA